MENTSQRQFRLTTADLKALHDHCIWKAAALVASCTPTMLVTESAKRKKAARELSDKAKQIDKTLMEQILTLEFNPVPPPQPMPKPTNRKQRRMSVNKQ